MPALILASTSRYRQQLLARLRIPFATADPQVDETALADETPAALAARLARAKAAAVAARHPQAWVIGSDQVADLDGLPLGKSGDHATATAQLTAASGRSVRFHTGLHLLRADDGRAYAHLDLTTVHFRHLDAAAIDRYLRAEQPYDCAGSFKCEGLGIGLFERIDNEDPTALVGLPLIALARLLREAGFQVP